MRVSTEKAIPTQAEGSLSALTIEVMAGDSQ